MRLTRTRSVAWSLVLALAACGDPARDRILPELSREGDIEVATLKALPSPLDPGWMWTMRPIREVRAVDDPTMEPLLYEPRSVLELRDGLLLVHDPMASEPLVIVDPAAATLISRFGKGGSGPGELSRDVALREAADGEIVVADRMNLQLHRYARSGHWLGSGRLELEGWPAGASFHRGLREGRFLAYLMNQDDQSRWYELAEVDLESGRSMPFLRFPELPRDWEPGTIQRGRQLLAVLADNIIGMWSAEPKVMVYDGDGRLARRIDLPLSQSRLTAADIEREVARIGGIARGLQPGPRALTNMLYAANDTIFGMFLSELWRAAEDPPLPSGTIYWRLFTVRGEYVGVVEQPENFIALGRGRGTIWARLLDDTGNPILTELELVRLDQQ